MAGEKDRKIIFSDKILASADAANRQNILRHSVFVGSAPPCFRKEDSRKNLCYRRGGRWHYYSSMRELTAEITTRLRYHFNFRTVSEAEKALFRSAGVYYKMVGRQLSANGHTSSSQFEQQH